MASRIFSNNDDWETLTANGPQTDSIEFAFREFVLKYANELPEPDDFETSAAGRPLSMYLPDTYEHKYAYPLVIWLHGAGGSEDDLDVLMPMISERNYLGLSLRSGVDYGDWECDSWNGVDEFATDLHSTVMRMRKVFNVHSERIYVAGFGSGAGMALQLMLQRPEWLAGSVMLSPLLPYLDRPLQQYRDLPGTRAFFSAGSNDSTLDSAAIAKIARLLHTAGVDVACQEFAGGHQITAEILQKLNHWIMNGISSAMVI